MLRYSVSASSEWTIRIHLIRKRLNFNNSGLSRLPFCLTDVTNEHGHVVDETIFIFIYLHKKQKLKRKKA